jgi:hypothetical protein
LDSQWSFIPPIEEKLMNEFGPFVANTHRNYVHQQHTTTQNTSKNVNANSDDAHYGWNRDDGVVNKFQRLH